MLRTLIVDDEPLALDVLETYISQMDQLHLVARCENAFEAQKILKSEEIDLLFLDIQMPQLTGIEFLKTLSNPPLTIFTTAYSEYALEGFELDVVDYLLKPISLERFIKAVNKAEERFDANQSANEQISNDEYFFVKADKKLVRVDFNDILYIEGLKDYVIIRMNAGRVITLQTMKSLELKLPTDIFRRIHRSYIINLTKIKAITGNMVEIKEKDQIKQIPVGKNYRDELLALVNKNRL